MLESTVHDVALVFEGGGMRNSYSAGAISVVLETRPRSPSASTIFRFAGG